MLHKQFHLFEPKLFILIASCFYHCFWGYKIFVCKELQEILYDTDYFTVDVLTSKNPYLDDTDKNINKWRKYHGDSEQTIQLMMTFWNVRTMNLV